MPVVVAHTRFRKPFSSAIHTQLWTLEALETGIDLLLSLSFHMCVYCLSVTEVTINDITYLNLLDCFLLFSLVLRIEALISYHVHPPGNFRQNVDLKDSALYFSRGNLENKKQQVYRGENSYFT